MHAAACPASSFDSVACDPLPIRDVVNQKSCVRKHFHKNAPAASVAAESILGASFFFAGIPFAFYDSCRMPDHSGKRWNNQLKCKGYSSSRSTKYTFAGKFQTSLSLRSPFSCFRRDWERIKRVVHNFLVLRGFHHSPQRLHLRLVREEEGVQTGRRKQQMMIMMIGQQLWLQQQVLLLCNFVL